jgi:Na+-transporting methylmalonyl-CoA/oxaloacetate decarboxylase gamma subunit
MTAVLLLSLVAAVCWLAGTFIEENLPAETPKPAEPVAALPPVAVAAPTRRRRKPAAAA